MKLSINVEQLKKGLFLTGLSLMCVSVSGCGKNETLKNTHIIESRKSEKADDILVISQSTLDLLNKYNKNLKDKSLNVNDLEYLSKFNKGIYYINSDNAYFQISLDNCVDIENKIVFDNSNNKKYDLLTGDIIKENITVKNSVSVDKYVRDNNISISGYALHINKNLSSKAVKKITNKYGKGVIKCIKKYGLPVAVYDVKDFFEDKSKTLNLKK